MKTHLIKKTFAATTLALTATSIQASTDYGPAIWNPLPNYYTSGNGHKFHVVHDIEGYYASLYSVLKGNGTSVHYGVNGKKDNSTDAPEGEIMQYVRDAQYGIHARCWNTHSTGTEHEGFSSNPAWYTDAMYNASAGITRNLAAKFGWAKDRNHIIAHGQKTVSGWPAYASANLGIDPYCNTHSDPGPYWDWTKYMNLVNGGTITPPAPAAPGGLWASASSPSQVNLTWLDSSNNEDNFIVSRSISGGAYSDIVTLGANVTAWSNTGLVPGTTYSYLVRARNGGGTSGNSNAASTRTRTSPCDFTGDGKTDYSIYRPSNGRWIVFGQPEQLWGTPGDIPVPG
ncbi:MAG: N-acetylmuramoyl-L-alanine amidase, partial [Limisphaerales bacterium]